MNTQLELVLVGGTAAPLPVRLPFNRKAKGLERCESPVERQLCLALAEAEAFTWRAAKDHPFRVGRWQQLSLLLLAQPQLGAFRPDFGIAPVGARPRDGVPLLIEVDGFDFHDRTRDQAQYDRWRDRVLVHGGSKILRFTGREVWRNAPACAAEVLRIAVRGKVA